MTQVVTISIFTIMAIFDFLPATPTLRELRHEQRDFYYCLQATHDVPMGFVCERYVCLLLKTNPF